MKRAASEKSLRSTGHGWFLVIEVDDQRQHLVVSHDLHQLLGVPGVRVEVSLWEPFQFPVVFGYYIILYNLIYILFNII